MLTLCVIDPQECVMARKPVSPDTAADPRKRAIDALMQLAATRDWDQIELTEIASEAGLSLQELRNLFPSKGAMLAGLARMIDDVVLAGDGTDMAAEPIKERLFDVMMRRIDAMTPYKPGLKRIIPALRRDPAALAAMNGVALNSWRYMLAASGVSTEDKLGMVRVQGAVLMFASVLNVWLDDDTPELERTMAALDRELVRGGKAMGRIEDVYRLTAPLRGLAQALCRGGRPMRRRERSEDSADYASAT
jgi:AcrR family transcriptional regulator